MHCHRALLEILIAKSSRPDLKHSALQRVARSHQLPFEEYALKATEKLGVDLQLGANAEMIKDLSGQWWERCDVLLAQVDAGASDRNCGLVGPCVVAL